MNELRAHESHMSDARASREHDARLLLDAMDAHVDEPTWDAATVDALDSLGVDMSEPDDADAVSESARDALDAYVLSVDAVVRVSVVIALGGPTESLSADMSPDGRYGTLERVGSITYDNSWAVPSSTHVPDGTALAELFDYYTADRSLDSFGLGTDEPN